VGIDGVLADPPYFQEAVIGAQIRQTIECHESIVVAKGLTKLGSEVPTILFILY
jgi:hypothetical protein